MGGDAALPPPILFGQSSLCSGMEFPSLEIIICTQFVWREEKQPYAEWKIIVE